MFVTKAKAIDIGLARWAGSSDEENLKLPAVSNLIAQSRIATFGTILLVIGFAMQAAASWPYW